MNTKTMNEQKEKSCEITEKILENKSFENIKHTDENGVEFWYARDLQYLLEYDEWRNFEKIVDKAKVACQYSKQEVSSHFVDVNKMVSIGLNTKRSLSDYKLTRYACYLIAQNGDPKKKPVSFAQTYFAIQTRKQEISQEYQKEVERLDARAKLTETEKKLSSQIYNRTNKDSQAFGYVRSKGDEVLFGGKTTSQMKEKLQIPNNRAIADFIPTVTIKAKDLAAEMTNYQMKQDIKIAGKTNIATKHQDNNQKVRTALVESGIKPEDLPKSEDIKRVERRTKKLKLEQSKELGPKK